MKKANRGEIIVCTPKRLPKDQWVPAAHVAADVNPVNRAPVETLFMAAPGFVPKPAYIAVLTTKYWGASGVRLTVGFLDSPSAELRKRILSHLNAWDRANVQFVATNTDPQVRIALTPGDGHWSYLGTDVLLIDRNQPTMNLDSFSMQTPESEYRRVVRHEAGHTLGFPHEHMRRQLVNRIDPTKAIKYYGATQGWDEKMVRAQVLTPIEESSLLGTLDADPDSIMCYQIPGTVTRDGKPIPGGMDIDAGDFDFAVKIYPKLGGAPKYATSNATKVRALVKKARRRSKRSKRK